MLKDITLANPSFLKDLRKLDPQTIPSGNLLQFANLNMAI
jgi:hypothetical protein